MKLSGDGQDPAAALYGPSAGPGHDNLGGTIKHFDGPSGTISSNNQTWMASEV